MERIAIDRLLRWKESRKRKPLIVRGARQVGKTWLMNEFGDRYFEKKVYINFDYNLRMKEIFAGGFDIERIILAINAETGITVESHNTLIILDEIQESPGALLSLKYFCEMAPEYYVIAAGSLLGVAMHRGTSFPVGKVDFMELYPLSYREFMYALGEKNYVDILDGDDVTLITSFKSKYIERLREYYYVGGMPEAVQTFVDEKDYRSVREIHNNLLTYYEQDFSKHAPANLVPRLNLVWKSIQSQLAKENKKYIYGQVRKGARAKDFELAIQWLTDCGLIHKVNRIKKPTIPVSAYSESDIFKLFLLDVGLLNAMANLDPQIIISGNDIFTEFKGAMTEQYVMQQFVSDMNVRPYYYSSPNSTGEIDFIIQGSTTVIPVEVKAEENLKARSLRAFYEKYKPRYSIRISMSDYREQDWMVNIPLYNIRRMMGYINPDG